MDKLKYFFTLSVIFGSLLFFASCEKDDHDDHDHIISNDGTEARLAYTNKGYSEVEVEPMLKSLCYFEKWNKEVDVPVSGLFEYYDNEGNWVASINFGDGSCDEWATKTWDVNLFPEYPTGTEDFSVLKFKKPKK
jgi:hypothetical protein